MLQVQSPRFGAPSDGLDAGEHDGEEETAAVDSRARTKPASHPAPSPPAKLEQTNMKEPTDNAIKGPFNLSCLLSHVIMATTSMFVTVLSHAEAAIGLDLHVPTGPLCAWRDRSLPLYSWLFTAWVYSLANLACLQRRAAGKMGCRRARPAMGPMCRGSCTFWARRSSAPSDLNTCRMTARSSTTSGEP